MLTANQITFQACQDARIGGAIDRAQIKLQIILDDLCLKHDFALARGVYYFPLNPTLITTIGGIANFGGPYPLPLDYLRTSGSSGSEGVQYAFFYVYNGVPYPLRPRDLGNLDMQVQQPGTQNLPYSFATDISPETTAQDRIAGTTTAATVAGSNQIVVFSPVNMQVGMAIAGNGIAPGSTITAFDNSVPDVFTVILSLTATATFVAVSGPGAAAVMFGTPPNAFVYPGPSGAFPTTLRYQRLMPPLLDFGRVPWFPDQKYLLKELTSLMMDTSDDTRSAAKSAEAARLLGEYEVFSDDKTNRAQTVILDSNRFGRGFNKLRNTKTIGW